VTVEGITLDCHDRILTVLKEHSDGLGVRELKRNVSEKCVRFRLPELLDEGFVEIKNRGVKRGQKKIIVITDFGREYLTVMGLNEAVQEKFYKACKVRSINEKIDLYLKILEDIFGYCLDAGNKGSAMRLVERTNTAFRNIVDKKLKYYEMEKRAYEKALKSSRDKG